MMIPFKMVKINVEQFAILSDEAPSGSIGLNISLSFKYSSEGKRIACVLDLKFEKDSTPVIVLRMNCEFAIPEDKWSIIEDDNSVNIPVELQKYLAAQTIGASRGILYCKTEGTPFGNLILPPINVEDIISVTEE